SVASRQSSPHLLGTNGKLSRFWPERFCGALPIGYRGRAHRGGNLRMGLAPSPSYGVAGIHWRGESWLVGGNHFHAFATNFSACEGRGRRHVACAIHDDRALGWL